MIDTSSDTKVKKDKKSRACKTGQFFSFWSINLHTLLVQKKFLNTNQQQRLR